MNNYEKMREVLEEIKKVSDDWELAITKAGALDTIYNLAQEALALPPRNCDVGTCDEQDDRWESFCASHHSPWKITGGTGTMICDCPCYKGNNKCNRFVWAQMPYAEEGGAK